MSNVYRLSGVTAEPRTAGANFGDKSNTTRAWAVVKTCIMTNKGSATKEQLQEALKANGMTFSQYVPYFVRREWLTMEVEVGEPK